MITAFGPQMTGILSSGSAPKQLSMMWVRFAGLKGNGRLAAMAGAAITTGAGAVGIGITATGETAGCALG